MAVKRRKALQLSMVLPFLVAIQGVFHTEGFPRNRGDPAGKSSCKGRGWCRNPKILLVVPKVGGQMGLIQVAYHLAVAKGHTIPCIHGFHSLSQKGGLTSKIDQSIGGQIEGAFSSVVEPWTFNRCIQV